ncbi:NPCBM/NEW2 domain-containing protein [Streptomyces sp. NPDC056160]|uniref:NPCBM/NEW2 domain-containing protein n=1 Tax=Streptomyces sp. NPDC056160 TaxID=3345731 RepID=UPI0035E12449
MRQLSARSARLRGIGALTAAVLCGAGLGAPAAVAEAQGSTPTGTSTSPGAGLVDTPPMGFNNWNSTNCRPEFNEDMVKGMADLFVAKGLKDAGYQYINLDDCWAKSQRDANGKLVPDPVRFPHGIKAVADYVHSNGLKLGIYTSAGTHTCSNLGFPGALGHEYSDAQQFADWGVDYLKYDNCSKQGVDAKQRYTTMADALKATGRPIVYSICEWGSNKPWLWAKGVGDLWRTTSDISDNWGSMLSIMKQNLPLDQYAGPGHWNDPDMLEVGNGGMTATEYRTHFSMWSIMAAPLLIGTDLPKADDATYQILENKDVIAVDQDTLGKQGRVLSSEGGRWVVVKEMADGSRAIALFNESNTAQRISTTAEAAGLPKGHAYRVRDLWQHRDYDSAGTFAATVPAHGTVLLRAWKDNRAASYPPAAELGASGLEFVQPGRAQQVTTTFTDLGSTSAKRVSVALTGPGGWQAKALPPTTARTLRSGKDLRTNWKIVAPKGTAPGTYDFTLTALYTSPRGTSMTTELPLQARIAVAPPSGDSYAGDLTPLSSVNGWGPIEKDHSNGEAAAGDGKTLTIAGTTYAKGLGTNATSNVEYYTAKQCSAFKATVGVDDEVGDLGSVTFEVLADGKKVASTSTLKGSDGAQQLTADVSGAQTVQLVVNDGGDGPDYDHGDWANAQFSC